VLEVDDLGRMVPRGLLTSADGEDGAREAQAVGLRRPVRGLVVPVVGTDDGLVGFFVLAGALPASELEPGLLDSFASLVGRACEQTRLTEEVREHERAMVAQQEALRAMATQLSIAEERERRKIALEVHDRLGQVLALARVAGGRARTTHDDALRWQILEELDARLADAVEETRTLEFQLSPPLLREFGLAAALQWLVEHHDDLSHAKCIFVGGTLDPALTDELAATLYRIARELFANALRHSQAEQIELALRQEGGDVVVWVSDDGRGFAGDRAVGLGLSAARERVAALGGELELRRREGGGTLAAVRLPLWRTGVSLVDEEPDLGAIQGRSMLERRIGSAVRKASHEEGRVSLCLFDLVGLARVNLIRGYHAGDLLLQQLATVLLTLAPAADVFRIGDDDFAVVLRAGRLAAYDLALRTDTLFTQHVGSQLRLACGIAVCPTSTTEASQLLRHADAALQWANIACGGGVVVFDAELADAVDAREYVRTLSERANMDLVQSLLSACRVRDDLIEPHSRRVALLAAALCERLGVAPEVRNSVRVAALLHDVGWLAIDERLPARANRHDSQDPRDSQDDRALRRLARTGEWMIKDAVPDDIFSIVRRRYERWDGRGHPDGLAGEDIPLGSRILAVSDAWDSIHGGRDQLSPLAEGALVELRTRSGGEFDPGVVEALIEVLTSTRD